MGDIMVEDRQTVPNRIPRPVVRPVEASSFGLTPKEIIAILRRHIFLTVCLTIIGFIAGGASWYLLRKYSPKYTARTLIEVLPPVERDPMDLRGILVNKDIQYGYRSSIASLMKQQSTLQDLLQRDKIRETNWFRHFGTSGVERIQKAYEDLERRFSVSAQRDVDFVVVSMTCGDKKEAALIVNEMVDLFVSSQGATKKKEATAKLKIYEDRRQKIQEELDYTTRQLKSVSESLPRGYVDLVQRQYRDISTLRLDSLQIEQDKLALEISQLQGIISSLEKQATGPINEQVENLIETDPIMVMLAQQKALHESELAGQSARFGEGHREIRRIQERISEIESRREARRQEIAEQVRRSNLANAQDQLVSLLQRGEELDKRRNQALKEKEDYDRARTLYEQLLQTRDERLAIIDDIKKQIEKQRMIAEDPSTGKVRSVGMAPEPRKMSSPRWELYFPVGTFLGFMLGLGLAFLMELLNDLVRTSRDVTRYLHIPLFGVIPDADEDWQLRGVDLCHVVRRAPYSISSESYRQLRINFELSNNEKPSKVVVLGSGMPGEGNTTIVVNLASALAAVEKKVLLIDANFRRPSFERVFSDIDKAETIQQAHLGLGDLVTGQSGSEEVVMPSPVKGIDIICAGTIPSNPSELFSGVRMKELIEEQRKSYDYIIIDGPPILLVSDARMLANLADGVMLVLNAGSTHRGAAQRTIRELRAVNANIVGCVLCAVKSLKGGYFQEQFKTYRRYQKVQLASPA
jgi:succinoglycan biosynthesis transport protein ExoP